MRKALGVRGPDRFAPQDLGKVDWGFDKMALPTAHLQGADLSQYVDILDQGNLGSCVAHAWEQALRVEARRRGYQGRLAELGSRLFGYYNARAVTGDQHADVGAFMRSYAAAASKAGRCPESLWVYDESKVNTRPPALAYQEAYAMSGIRGYYRIFDQGAARLDAECSALEAGHPVVFSVPVDKPFMDNAGPAVVSVPKGEPEGNHALCCVGYEVVNGVRRFKIANSWGVTYREEGYVWFDEELMAWVELEDVWVASLVAA